MLSDIEIIRRVHFNTSGDTKEGRSVLLMEFLLKDFLLRTCAFGMHSQHVKSCASNVALLLELGKSFPGIRLGSWDPSCWFYINSRGTNMIAETKLSWS